MKNHATFVLGKCVNKLNVSNGSYELLFYSEKVNVSNIVPSYRELRAVGRRVLPPQVNYGLKLEQVMN